MQLALLGGGSDPPQVIPWWIVFASLTVIYNSWDSSSCLLGLFAITLVKLLFVAIHEVKGLTSIEEYVDSAFPQTSDPCPPDATWRTWFKPYPGIDLEWCQTFMDGVLHEMKQWLLTTSAPFFEGRETEANWSSREQTITTMRKWIFDLEPDIKEIWLHQMKRNMLDGLLKCPNSLRTTVSTNGCLLFQDIAKVYGSGIDSMVEILLQNFIKLCANTKLITRANANDTVLTIIGNVSYHIRIMQHIHSACQDKNVHPRKFACEWLKKVIKRHPRSTIEHHGGLDLIEKSIKLGLEDRDKNVRETMRPTYWNFARRWPERSEIMFSSLDKVKQDQLLADPSNPNATTSTDAASSTASAPANSTVSVQRNHTSTVPKPVLKGSEAQQSAHESQQNTHGESDKPEASRSAKPTLKEIKASMKKAQSARNDPNIATSSTQAEVVMTQSAQEVEQNLPSQSNKAKASINAKPTLKETKAALKKQQMAHNDANIASSDAQPGAVLAQTVNHASNEDVNPAKYSSQIETQGAKQSSISAAPIRRKKPAPVLKTRASINKFELEDEAQGPSAQTEERSEAEQVNINPVKGEATTSQIAESQGTSAALPDATPSSQAAKQMDENPKPRPRETAFLNDAVRKLRERDMDAQCWHVLQIRFNQDLDSPRFAVIIDPLCEWLENPPMDIHEEERLSMEDQQAYALATLRTILIKREWAVEYYPRILLGLTNCAAWYKSRSHVVRGIQNSLNFLINHGNVLECLDVLSQQMHRKLELTEDEFRLIALGAMLHRIHTEPEQESRFYQLLGSEAEIVNRLGKIGSTAIRSEIASVRQAAIKYAQEFWHLIPEKEFYLLIAGGDKRTENLLVYYLARHVQLDDHVVL